MRKICRQIFYFEATQFATLQIDAAGADLWNLTDCRTHSVGLHIRCFHLGQVVGRGELEVVLQVNLEQGVVVADIILRT